MLQHTYFLAVHTHLYGVRYESKTCVRTPKYFSYSTRHYSSKLREKGTDFSVKSKKQIHQVFSRQKTLRLFSSNAPGIRYAGRRETGFCAHWEPLFFFSFVVKSKLQERMLLFAENGLETSFFHALLISWQKNIAQRGKNGERFKHPDHPAIYAHPHSGDILRHVPLVRGERTCLRRISLHFRHRRLPSRKLSVRRDGQHRSGTDGLDGFHSFPHSTRLCLRR